uniref:KNOX1 domain-containing protein n=1 Tax=Opuntia streptacantha TaxID=393608 RepID=A0A7C9CTN9_OPUST
MEEMFSDKALMSPDNFGLQPDYHSLMMNSGVGGVIPFRDATRLPVFGSDELMSAAASVISEAASFTPPEIRHEDDTSSTAIKAKIAAHPRYPRLLQAYIDCHKVITN